ncbi:MAG: hypothetical protein R3E60_05400 [Alphaproteobacteria bacterium]
MPRSSNLKLGLLALFLIKITIACIFGPIYYPDSSGYTLFADKILQSAAWLTQHGDAVDFNLVFRTAGYPLIIAGFKSLFTTHWTYAILVFQAFCSCLAFAPLLRILETTVARRWIIWVALLCYGFSGSTLFDTAILTDSLNASIFIAVVSIILGGSLGLWRLSLLRLTGLGLLWGYGVWMRDAGLYLTIIPIALLCTGLHRQRLSLAPLIRHSLIFLLPITLMAGAYMEWNYYRTGYRAIGGTSHMNWLQMPMYMEGRGYGHPFLGDDEVDTAVRRAAPTDFDTLDAVAKVLAELHKAQGYNERQLAEVAFKKYITTMLHHPLGFLRNTAHNFQPHATAFLLTDPLWNLNEFYQFGPGRGVRLIEDPGKILRQLRVDFSLGRTVLLITSTLTRGLSIALFVLFLIGVPLAALLHFHRLGRLRDPAYLAFSAWASFFVFAGLYATVYVEMRYFTPIIPLALIGMALAVDRTADFLVGWWMRRSPAH